MTDRELDSLVAEHVMGWKPGLVVLPGMGGREIPGYLDGDREVAYDWSPSASIADAWQVTEHLRTFGLVLTITNNHPFETYPGWVAFFQEDGTVISRPGEGKDVSAPRAICIAALKALGVDNA